MEAHHESTAAMTEPRQWNSSLSAVALVALAVLLALGFGSFAGRSQADASASSPVGARAIGDRSGSAVHRRTSHVLLWKALDGKVICGVVFHLQNQPASQILCQARVIPPPANPPPDGDPGFVFLSGNGRPDRAMISPYTWQAPPRSPKFLPTLRVGQKWSYRRIGVACRANRRKVVCVNRSRHGFVITKRRYRSL